MRLERGAGGQPSWVRMLMGLSCPLRCSPHACLSAKEACLELINIDQPILNLNGSSSKRELITVLVIYII